MLNLQTNQQPICIANRTQTHSKELMILSIKSVISHPKLNIYTMFTQQINQEIYGHFTFNSYVSL